MLDADKMFIGRFCVRKCAVFSTVIKIIMYEIVVEVGKTNNNKNNCHNWKRFDGRYKCEKISIDV